MISYFTLYEDLYKIGYHADMNWCHTLKILPILSRYEGHKILDVGCSHGLAVKKLIEMSYDAYGVDVSETAIKYCKERGLFNCVLGSATDMPFEKDFFDIIISSDTLEHIFPQDIDIMINEFKRVCKKYVILAIACGEEIDKSYVKINHKYGLKSLHTSILKPEEWDDKFSKAGFIKLEDSINNTHYIVIYENRIN
jgi:ubiquinone/menaquinone biosynthesis C-methylase UbiE